MPAILRAICAGITSLQVDVIVNAANISLLPGGGACRTIHRAAEPELAEECRLLGGCQTSEAKLTKGYRLPGRYVIHTVGPVWKDGNDGEPALLASCYRCSLEVAAANGIATIVFLRISTDTYGYPIELAANVAIGSVRAALAELPTIREVTFCCYSPSDLAVYKQLLVEFC
jgi:O-acetyl-ADP-ribose deacetylase